MGKEYKKIAEVLYFQEGPGVRNTQYTSSGVKLLNVANLSDGKVDLSTSDRYISEEEAYGKYKHFLCDEGDFVIASSGIKVEYIDKKMGFVDKSMLPLCMNTSTIRFKVLDPSMLRIRYFMYYLKSNHFKVQLAKHITGSAQLNYGPSHLKKMVMPWDTLEKQDEAISKLDSVQALIDYRQQQIIKLDELVKSRFVELFGESKTNLKGWDTVALERVANVGSSKRVFVEELQEEGVPFYRGTEVGALAEGQQITPELYITENHYHLLIEASGSPAKGDLLMPSICSDGRIWLVDTDKPFYFKDGRVLWIHPTSDCINSCYLQYVLKEKIMTDYSSIASGTTFAELKIFALKALRVMLPPLRMQNQFAAFVAQVDKSKLAVKRSLRQLETLKKSLMQEYFG